VGKREKRDGRKRNLRNEGGKISSRDTGGYAAV
jgi:hypothetical protein